MVEIKEALKTILERHQRLDEKEVTISFMISKNEAKNWEQLAKTTGINDIPSLIRCGIDMVSYTYFKYGDISDERRNDR